METETLNGRQPQLALHGVPSHRTARHFDEARDQIEADDQGKWDTTVPRERIIVRNGDVTFPPDAAADHMERVTPTAWATTQLCHRLGIPTAYFRRCPTVLRDVQANYWLRQPVDTRGPDCLADELGGLEASDTDEFGERKVRRGKERRTSEAEQWLLRLHHGHLRGILTERYRRFDNEMVVRTLQVVLGSELHSRFSIGWFGLTDEALHLRSVDTTARFDAVRDDALMAGIHISNSEVGKRALRIDAMVFRLVCLNGLIRLVKGKSLLYQRHVLLDTAKFQSLFAEAVQGALEASTGFLQDMAHAITVPIPDVDGTIERLGERWSLTHANQDSVRDALRREHTDLQETVYGLVNAFTNVAQRLPDDDRYQLERLAGLLLEPSYLQIGSTPSLRRTVRSKTLPGPIRMVAPGYGNLDSEIVRVGDHAVISGGVR